MRELQPSPETDSSARRVSARDTEEGGGNIDLCSHKPRNIRGYHWGLGKVKKDSSLPFLKGAWPC